MVLNMSNGVEHVKWYGTRQIVWNKTNLWNMTNGVEQDKWC